MRFPLCLTQRTTINLNINFSLPFSLTNSLFHLNVTTALKKSADDVKLLVISFIPAHRCHFLDLRLNVLYGKMAHYQTNIHLSSLILIRLASLLSHRILLHYSSESQRTSEWVSERESEAIYTQNIVKRRQREENCCLKDFGIFFTYNDEEVDGSIMKEIWHIIRSKNERESETCRHYICEERERNS